MTPREFAVYIEAHNQKIQDKQEQRQREIYASAFLISRFVWAKKIPAYEKVFGSGQKQEMTDKEMLKQVEALNALFGGTDLRKEKCEWQQSET